MPHDLSGNGTPAHSTVLPINPATDVVSYFFLRCDSSTNATRVAYRALPAAHKTHFPRTGNLWGSSNFKPWKSKQPDYLKYAARVDLWLGADWNSSEIAGLRSHNPSTLVLTSINAVEHGDGLPEEYYLHNITRPAATRGRIETWPGSYRLDVTNPEVQRYQANRMYSRVLGPDQLQFDGIFVDNVFLDWGISANRADIHGNPFYPCTNPCSGVPDDPDKFNAAWRAGIAAELALFREVMPHALMDGHAMNVREDVVAETFNAISLGFVTPKIVEGLQDFDTGLANYHDWMRIPARTPHVTMVESAVRLMIGRPARTEPAIS
jgi:hypothetical protein